MGQALHVASTGEVLPKTII